MKKTIRLFCYGPIACDPRNQSPWEDVWIQYSYKRKIVKEGPCIVSIKDFEGELKHYERRLEKHSEWDPEETFDMKNRYRVRDEIIAGSRFALRDDKMITDMPDIYVNEEWITRKNAEEAIAWYLRKKGILKSKPRFQWHKPKFVAQPVGY